MSDPKRIGAWVGLGFAGVTLVGMMWAGFQKLDAVNELPGIVRDLSASVNRLDSLTMRLDRYRRLSICRQSGYADPSACPLLMLEMGMEPLEPGNKAKLPEIP